MQETLALTVPPGPVVLSKIGVVAPYDMALDHEMGRWAEDRADLYFARSPFEPSEVNLVQAELLARPEMVADTALRISAVSPDCYIYACTSASFVHGRTGERELAAAVHQRGLPKLFTVSSTIVAALSALKAGTVAVAGPYTAAVTQRFTEYLGEAGLEVCRASMLGLSGEICKVPYTHTAELVASADHPDAEAVVVACTNLPTYHLIAPLEEYLGKPVITANQAVMWAALDYLALAPVGPGQRLLSVRADGTAR
ncbi:Asp/Glu racemase [Arthrobacter crystallopoietes BAB-32]|uniref:Asp/Glu racemase n=1 Tax=Arthrobacter crystallopoietes BAB-32 TaxID=1246476 RepID=N1V1L0_9MICC|nr:aspartate/glutamate racemase family protein [Arthrobacter crystallopoietes]EMY33957.1 Asp/Glu racemase [Arthrobacter crystallopoietes BAB-32]